MDLKDFSKDKDWVKVWSGRWSLYTDSHFGYHFTVQDVISGAPAFEKVVYVYKDYITDCWVSEADKGFLAERMLALAQNDEQYPLQIAKSLKAEAQHVAVFIGSHNPQNVTEKELSEFWHLIGDYYVPHLSVKYIVDFLSPEQLEKFLPALEDARLYSETTFRDEENFVEAVAEHIGSPVGYAKENIFSVLKEELDTYFKNGSLPEQSILQSRFRRSALIFEKGENRLFTGDEVEEVERIIFPKTEAGLIRGQTAYKGIAKGKVKVVFDPAEAANSFQEGDILVTGMTRPEFLPLMKKAAAFVTDAGGVLSHAAIVARELKKSCVIGTQIATKVLKDGDFVEVDAEKGVVTIIKKA